MVYEYWHIDDTRKMSARLFYHLFLRGYSSIFHLAEYRIKRCVGDQIICEAEIESEKAHANKIHDQKRRNAQMIHLLFNALINIALAVWFFRFSGYSEGTCYPGYPCLWIVVVTAGAPLSLFFTYLMQVDAVHKAITELGLKPIEALNNHMRSVLKRGNLEEIKECLEILEKISNHDRKRVAKVIDPRDRSVLCYVLHCDFVNGENLKLFVKFYDLGFPILRDVKELLVQKNNSTKPVSGKKKRESLMTQFKRRNSQRHSISEIFTEMKLWEITPLSLYPVPEEDDMQSKICDEDNVALHIRNFIYFWGGKSSDPSSLVVYDIKNRTAELKSTKGDIPHQLRKSTATVGSDELIYLFGGVMDANNKRGETATNDLYCLDVKTMKWSKIDYANKPKDFNIPSPRSSVAMWRWDDNLWIFGGERNHESIEYNLDNSIHRFNLKTKTWTQIEASGAHPPERYGVATCVDGNDRLYLYGGMQLYGTSNQLFMLKKEDKLGDKLRWTGLPSRRKLPAVVNGAICLKSNDLLILGGGWKNQNASTLFSYNLEDTIDEEAAGIKNKSSKLAKLPITKSVKSENKSGARKVSKAERVTSKISILLTLPDLVHGEQARDRDDFGNTFGIRHHHMFFDTVGKKVIVLGGKWGPCAEENNFIVECDFPNCF